MQRLQLLAMLLGLILVAALANLWRGKRFEDASHPDQTATPSVPQERGGGLESKQNRAERQGGGAQAMIDTFRPVLAVHSLTEVPDGRTAVTRAEFEASLAELVRSEHHAVLFLAFSQLGAEDREFFLRRIVLEVRSQDGASDTLLAGIFRLLRVDRDASISLRAASALVVEFNLDAQIRTRIALPPDGTEFPTGQAFESAYYEVMRRMKLESDSVELSPDLMEALLPAFQLSGGIRLLNETLFASGDADRLTAPLREILRGVWDLDPICVVYLASRLKFTLPEDCRLDVVGALKRVGSPESCEVLARLWVRQDDSSARTLLSQMGEEVFLRDDFSVGLARELVERPEAKTWPAILSSIQTDSLSRVIDFTINLSGASFDDSDRSLAIGLQVVFLIGRLELEAPGTVNTAITKVTEAAGWDLLLTRLSTRLAGVTEAEMVAGMRVLRK